MTATSPEQAFRRYLDKRDASAFATFYDLTVEDVVAVAVRLARDAVHAEDLVQATYLAALEGCERYDPTLRIVPWLVGICTNQARKQRRLLARDERSVAPAPTGEPDPQLAAEHAELRESLAHCVAKLPEIYRPVLVLSLENELTPAQIARALDRSPATVRSQLFRGLELLRAALPRGIAFAALAALLPTKGLAAVRAVVVAKSGVSAGALAFMPALGGSVLMKKIVAAAVLVLLVGTAWLVYPRGERHFETTLAGQVMPASRASSPADEGTSQPASLPRTEVRQHGGAELASLRLRLVWQRDGSPAPGVRGVLRERSRAAPRLFERELETDATGSFSCGELLPGEIEVITDRSNHHFTLLPGERAEKLFAIPEGLDLTVRVVDLDKQPIAGAEIWCSSDYDWSEGCVVGRTDARGLFGMKHFGLGRSLAARAPGYEPAVSAKLTGKPGERAVEEIVLERGGAALRGTVRLQNGALAAGALVQIRTNMSRQQDALRGGFHAPPPATHVRTDAAGSYFASGLPSSLLTVSARAAAGGLANQQVFVKAGETGTLDLQVPEAVPVRGTVRARSGAPLVGARVLVDVADLGSFSRSEAVTDSEGRFGLEGVTPGERTFQATSGGSWVNHSAIVAPDMAELELVIALPETGERIAGMVLDENGTPCAGWVVRSVPRPGRMFQAITDAQGGFAFDECPEPTTKLVIGGPDANAFVPVHVLDSVARGSSVIRIVVPQERARFGKLTVRVVGPDRGPLSRVLVRVLVEDGERLLDRHTGPDGIAEFSALPPGRYGVSVRAPGFGVVSLGTRKLPAAGGLDLGTVVLSAAVTLRARLVGPVLSEAHAHAALYTRGGEHVVSQSARSTPKELLFEEVPPGDYVARLGGIGIAARNIPVIVAGASEQVAVWQVEKGHSVLLRMCGCTMLAELDVEVRDAVGAVVSSIQSRCLDQEGTQSVGLSLAAGAYVVRAREVAGPAVERPLTVPSSPPARIHLELPLR